MFAIKAYFEFKVQLNSDKPYFNSQQEPKTSGRYTGQSGSNQFIVHKPWISEETWKIHIWETNT